MAVYSPDAPNPWAPYNTYEQPRPSSAPPTPRYDYNAGSPPDQALTPGHGWVWEAPESVINGDPAWNASLGQWDRGVWQQRQGQGLGYQAPPAPTAPASPSKAPSPQAGAQSLSFQPAAAMAPAPQISTPPITDQVTQMLMARLNELRNPLDINADPTYRASIRAYQLGQMRSAEQQRRALAERAGAGGTLGTGGFNVGVQGIKERAGENTARYNAGLMQDRLASREAQLMEAIKIARAVGQDDIANQLELQRLQLQQELGRGDLALRSELGRGNLGLGYDQLGLSYADLVMKANQAAYQAALGGDT